MKQGSWQKALKAGPKRSRSLPESNLSDQWNHEWEDFFPSLTGLCCLGGAGVGGQFALSCQSLGLAEFVWVGKKGGTLYLSSFSKRRFFPERQLAVSVQTPCTVRVEDLLSRLVHGQ